MKYPTSPPPSSSQSNSALPSSLNISRNVSPLPMPGNYRTDCMSASNKSFRFFRRLCKFTHMDFQSALSQMVNLFIAPHKIFKQANYRKHTKSQFARDDPAFLVLLVISLCLSSFAISIVTHASHVDRIYLLLYVVFVDFLLVGVIVATIMWLLVNRLFRANQYEQDVEWAYAFDIHINAFFPPSLLLHFFQLFFYGGLINHPHFLSRLFGNGFWFLALSYYVYISFLGYNSVPFLKNVRYLLSLLPIIFLFYIVTTISGWNLSVTLIDFYRLRV